MQCDWGDLDTNIPSRIGKLWEEDDPSVLAITLNEIAGLVAHETASLVADEADALAKKILDEICHTGGPFAVLMAVERNNDDPAIMAAAFRCLRSVCYKTAEGKQIVGEVGGIGCICEGMKRFPNDSTLQQEALGALYVLAVDNSYNHRLLADNEATVKEMLELHRDVFNAFDLPQLMSNNCNRYGPISTRKERTWGMFDGNKMDDLIDLKDQLRSLKDLWRNEVAKVKQAITFWAESCHDTKQKNPTHFFPNGIPDLMVGKYTPLFSQFRTWHSRTGYSSFVAAKQPCLTI